MKIAISYYDFKKCNNSRIKLNNLIITKYPKIPDEQAYALAYYTCDKRENFEDNYELFIGSLTDLIDFYYWQKWKN